MNEVSAYLRQQLLLLADENYRKFQQPLIPTVAPDRFLGVRTPVLRRFALSFGKSKLAPAFLNNLPHDYYDEDNLHAFLIEQIKDFYECVAALDKFLPYVDNWATCDMMSPKVLAAYPERMLIHIDRWITSVHTYEVRFGILCLMRYYLGENFKESLLYKVAGISSCEYYINMARAWYFATALAFQWDCTLMLLKENRLDDFTHNKTIQKAVESYRITTAQKQILRGLRRKH